MKAISCKDLKAYQSVCEKHESKYVLNKNGKIGF